MAANAPLSRIVLAARSVADDLDYVALADISGALEAKTDDYRIIGGQTVTALVAGWDLVSRSRLPVIQSLWNWAGSCAELRRNRTAFKTVIAFWR